jgi:hypothetical protein
LPHVKRYLAEIAALGLNGVLIKISVLPLNYDLQSMNLEFFAYLDQIVFGSAKSGINISSTYSTVGANARRKLIGGRTLSAQWRL